MDIWDQKCFRCLKEFKNGNYITINDYDPRWDGDKWIPVYYEINICIDCFNHLKDNDQLIEGKDENGELEYSMKFYNEEKEK